MEIKKRICAIVASVMLVLSIGGFVNTKPVAAATGITCVEDAYHFVPGNNSIGYIGEMVRDRSEIVVVHREGITCVLRDNDYNPIAEVPFINGRAVFTVNDVPAEYRGEHGCFTQGLYTYFVNRGSDAMFNGTNDTGNLIITNSYENVHKPNGEGYRSSYSVSRDGGYAEPNYRSVPFSMYNVNSYTFYGAKHSTGSNPYDITAFDGFMGEYYYVVYYSPTIVTSRSHGGYPEPTPVAIPTDAVPVYVSDMQVTVNGFSCEFGVDQGAPIVGDFFKNGTYITRVYTASGVEIELDESDMCMIVASGNTASDNITVTGIEVVSPTPIMKPSVSGVSIDGNTANLNTLSPEGDDLTDAAKADLTVGPHTVVLTFADGSTQTFTVQGTKPIVTPTTVATPTANPVPTHTPEQETGVAGFVERLYTVVLERESDSNGKADWTNRLLTHQENGRDVALGFLHSPEFLGKELNDHDWLTVLYRTFFDRQPDQMGYDYWTNNMNNGMTRDEVIDGFINSTEWATICWMYGIRSGGTGIPNTSGALPENEIIAFATRLYTTCLERNADPVGLISWAQILINGEQSGSQVAHGFFFSPEFLNSNVSDADYVTRLYRTFMDREPDTAGYNDWMSRIAAGATREDVFNGFTGSPEWAQRCAASGIVAN